MTYNFKKFEGTGGKYETRITLTASRSIGLPTKFYEENNINNYKYVVLFYDEEQMVIGLKFTSDEVEPHKYTIIKGDKYGASVVVTSFFKKYNLDPKMYRGKYEWEKEETEFGTLFVIKLNKE